MKHGFVKVGAVTPEIVVANTDFNAKSIIALIEEGEKNGAEILLFPPNCVTGNTLGELKNYKTLLDGAKNGLSKIIKSTEGGNAFSVVGLPYEKDGKVYDCTAVIRDGALLSLIPDEKVDDSVVYDFGEETYFGNDIIFKAESVPSFTFTIDRTDGIITLLPTATIEMVGEDERVLAKICHESYANSCAIVRAGAGEGESTTDEVFGGRRIIAENGKVIASGELFTTGITYADIDTEFLLAERLNNGFTASDLNEITFAVNETNAKFDRKFKQLPFIPSENKAERAEYILAMQANALKKRIKHTTAKTAVIGISGGLDSTLALLATVRAFKLLGKPLSEITAISMPCFGTTKRTKTNAQRLCESLGVTFRTINIARSVRSHFADIGQDESVTDVTYENAQARERTQVLMDIANQQGGMVIGTGDLSELALGWATYNGDHMSMYAINSSIPKTLVRFLVSYEAEKATDEKIKKTLLDILDTPVSPELLPAKDGEIAQKTEDLVGPYELHDFFLYHFVRRKATPSKIYAIAKCAFEGVYDEKTIEKWLKTFIRRFFTQQFKRSCMPDGVKVGSVSLSPRGDFVMPSDASFSLWLEELEKEINA